MRSSSIGRRARPAYPVLLLVAALAAGCAPEARPAAAPGNSWQSPSAP
ncbi:M23 family peptidase, partial [Micromonospora sp. AMSO31t]